MGESIPVSIGRAEQRPQSDVTELASPGAAIGNSVAGMLRHLVAVLDREDRLESGSGEWLALFTADAGASRTALQQSVLRAMHLASDPLNFEILKSISDAGNPQQMNQLGQKLDLNALSVAERVSDLVSAGLATKIPGANQVSGTPAAVAIVALVTEAIEAGEKELGAG